MLKFFLNLLMCVLLIECKNSTSDKMQVLDEHDAKNTSVSFTIIEKDNAHIDTYHFDKKNSSKGIMSFNYIGKEDSFRIICDTTNKKYNGHFGQGNSIELDFEKLNYYTINGIDFKVFKLIAEKNTTDGAFSLFISPDWGLLLNKSSTWRAAKVLCPDKSNSSYLQLTTLLYRIQTDDEFFSNPIPDIKKFTTPKVE